MAETTTTVIPPHTLATVNRATANDISQEWLVTLVDELFAFKPWNQATIDKGAAVKEPLKAAYMAIIQNVPSSPTRTRALNMLTDCRMLVNQTLTFEGAV